MNDSSFELFNEKLGNKVEFGVLCGKSMSGKTEVAGVMCSKMGYTSIDMNEITASVKASKGTEEEPFEGEVPIADVEAKVVSIINAQKAGGKCKFVFDGYTHTSDDEFITFIEKIGCPEFLLCLTANEENIKARWCKKNEAEEVPEDVGETMKADSSTNADRREKLLEHFAGFKDRCTSYKLDTSISLESLARDLNGKFSPKIVLVNHEKQLGVDNVCSNLSIKYNMIYISAYQVIKQHIQSKSEWGVKLMATRRNKNVVGQLNVQDGF
jgi:hypothetical protein